MEIYRNNIYIIKYKEKEILALILYNLSIKHYMAVELSIEKKKTFNHEIESINKYADTTKLLSVNKSQVVSCIYVKGKPLTVKDSERQLINKQIKKMLIDKIDKNTNHCIEEDINFVNWCQKKIYLNKKKITAENELYKQNGIYWVDFGFNVGSELRKIRPALLWRSTADNKMWTVIPISTKCMNDKYYFHYDLEEINATMKIESMMNLSCRRVLEPYFSKGKTVFINTEQYEKIKNCIKKYYVFDSEL